MGPTTLTRKDRCLTSGTLEECLKSGDKVVDKKSSLELNSGGGYSIRWGWGSWELFTGGNVVGVGGEWKGIADTFYNGRWVGDKEKNAERAVSWIGTRLAGTSETLHLRLQ